MVFLGGAVLANIVSANENLTICIYSHCADGRQGGHVDIKAGVAGAGLTSVREAGRKIVSMERVVSKHLHHNNPLANRSIAWHFSKLTLCVAVGSFSLLPAATGTTTYSLIHVSTLLLYPTFLRARPAAEVYVKFSRTGDRRTQCNIVVAQNLLRRKAAVCLSISGAEPSPLTGCGCKQPR